MESGQNRFTHTLPSQPLSTCPMVAKASAKRSGSLPFKSTVARQPWNPSREWTSFGRSLYISLETPPMYKSPMKEQDRKWLIYNLITFLVMKHFKSATKFRSSVEDILPWYPGGFFTSN